MRTIAQISTPLGSGGIAVVRISGKDSLQIAKGIFTCKAMQEEIKPRYMYYGTIDFEGITEKCLMVYFKAPFSYTGEDVVEFQCHGGELLTTTILKACLQGGAKLAENGEFTKQAFLNGKISLDEAESVIDMINATSTAELKANSKVLKGDLYKKVTSLQESIKDAIVNLEVSIDYPEHDDEAKGVDYLKQTLNSVKQELLKLKETVKNGQTIRSGINVAIVGKPNVGKSSLLNALIGQERAIVTNVKGTTRDILTETIQYNGIKLNFIDTAGIHESEDTVEKIGISRSKESINEADIVLAVFDGGKELDLEDQEVLKLCENSKNIVIINKIDVCGNKTGLRGIEISAQNGSNIEEVKQKIYDVVIGEKIDFSGLIITNERHAEAINSALEEIEEILSVCDSQTMDILDMQTKALWKTLGKITGRSENEDIISGIFAKFCLGK